MKIQRRLQMLIFYGINQALIAPQRRKFALVKLPIAPVGTQKSTTGRKNCCQNAPVAIRHKNIINYINSYICRELSFESYFTCFHNKYQRNPVSFVLTLLCSGNIGLYFENCPWFIWNCPWFTPNPHEPGAIVKCKLPLGPAGLFQGLDVSAWFIVKYFPFFFFFFLPKAWWLIH